ncbi:uncharacterized protein Tco_0896650 [Tanacetum coccineum]
MVRILRYWLDKWLRKVKSKALPTRFNISRRGMEMILLIVPFGKMGVETTIMFSFNAMWLDKVKKRFLHGGIWSIGGVNSYEEHGELQVNSRKRIRVSNENDNNDSYNNNDSYDNNESYESSGSEINESFEKLKQMFRNMEGTNDDNVQEKLQKLFDDAIKPLYNGCTKFSILNAVVKLFNIKAKHGWSDVSFTELLEVLHEMFPDDNKLPISLYQARKMMSPMGLEIEIIHACPNDCMLYRGVYVDLHKCFTCGESRYKSKQQNNNNVNKKQKNKYDEDKVETNDNDDAIKIGPPAKQIWYFPIIPRLKQLFANEKDAKLLRWHAEGRKRDGKLRHVADSPQWRKIDNKFDKFGAEIRNIRFGLSSDGINPFGNMSSNHSTWPVLLCVYNLPPRLCMKRKYVMMSLLIQGPKQPGNDIDVYLAPLIDDMKTLWGSGVEVYDVYRKEKFQLRAMIFCTISDFPPYGNLSGYSTKDRLNGITRIEKKEEFDGKTEYGSVRTRLDAQDALSQSIFWDLEYWEHLDVRHCLDVMHIEKNVAESLIGLLLNIHGKTKDGVPSGYSANIKKLVSIQDCKLLGMKSHGCHVLMTHMIPIAIRGEIKAIGPVHLHNMYPYERYMGFLKGFVRNWTRPDASIVKGYYSEELVEFSSSILKGVENIGIPHSRHEGRLLGVGTIRLRAIDPDRDLLEVAHSMVLQHVTCVAPYIEEHMEMLRRTNPGRKD